MLYFMYTSEPGWMSLEWEWKPDHPKESHTNTGRTLTQKRTLAIKCRNFLMWSENSSNESFLLLSYPSALILHL